MFELSQRSLTNLQGVHPKLVDVVVLAIQLTKVDFGVSEGLRAEEKQEAYLAKGVTTTLDSKHLKQEDGYSHAVDLFVLDSDGKVTWEHAWFRPVVQAMFTAAILLGVPIKAGCLWRTFQDSPHFELDLQNTSLID